MAINSEQTFSLDLSLFGGKVSDLAPGNLPAGVSPDNTNMFYFPQGVCTRPAFIHALAAAVGVDVSVLSHAPYTPPGGNYYITVLDGALNLWLYNVVSEAITNVFTLSPWATGNQKYFAGSQLFDKFFMAFFDPNNGLNIFSCGADVPRYINALGHCNRVTIDGPGGGLVVTNMNLINLFNPANFTVGSSFERTGNIVTVTLASTSHAYPNPLPIPGWFIQIYDQDTAVPAFNEVMAWSQSSAHTSWAVQSAYPGGNTPGNIVWVYYRLAGATIDTGLVAAYAAAQSGGYTMYVQIANPVFGPAGIFPVTNVGGYGDFVVPQIPGSHAEDQWFYFGYQVPGVPQWAGVSGIQNSNPATYAYSTASVTPDGTVTAGGVFAGNELYQQIGETTAGDFSVSLISDGSGTIRVICPQPIVNLPIASYLWLLVPAGDSIPFTTGWIQVASVTGNISSGFEFTISVPGAQVFNVANCQLYEYWGSLNTTVNLTQPVPGTPVGTNAAQIGAQGFQLTAVTKLANGGLQLQWYQLGPNSTNSGAANRYALTPQSAATPGNRQAFSFFISEDAGASPGSPPVNFTTLGGPNFVSFTLPLGPSPTVARGIAITPSNGADFFVIPPANVPATGGVAPLITPGTIIYDDITTSQYIDWSDAALVAAIPTSGVAGAGSDYGDLTSTINLPPCYGVKAYEAALVWFGEYNNTKNLLNMSMQGGVAAFSSGDPTGPPLGWDNTTAHNGITPDQESVIALAPDDSGWMLTFLGSASHNYNGMISQSAYQDVWGAPIVQPNQEYTIVLRASATGTTGQLNFLIESDATSTVYATGTLLASALTSTLTWTTVVLTGAMPPYIPPDMRLMIYRSGEAADNISMADVFLVNTNTPVLTNQLRVSYPANPFGYDNENGYTLITASPNPIVAAFLQRKYLYALTTAELLVTFDSGEIPAEWGLEAFALNCGGSGPNGVDSQDDIAWWLGLQGVQAFDGSKPKKISQEIQPDTDLINWSYRSIIGCASDPIQRVVYFTVPTAGSVLSNVLLTMNHRMADPSVNIMDPVHVSSYTGKMIATDLARKWGPWPVPCNSLGMCYILAANGALVQAMTFGLGVDGPTGADAESQASGASGPLEISLAPGNSTDFLVVVSSAYNTTAPAGWTRTAQGFFHMQASSTAEVTFDAPTPAPNTEWSALMVSLAATGTPTLEQTVEVDDGTFPEAEYNRTFGSSILSGDSILVSFVSVSSESPVYKVSDSSGNLYTVYQNIQNIGGTYYTSYLAIALGCKAGSPTVTITTSNYGETGSFFVYMYNYRHINGPVSYGQVYAQDFVNYPPANPAASEWNTEDADFGSFSSNYFTYFFFAHDIEQNAMLALYRKLFCYMSTHLIGDGDLTITPYVDALNVPWTSLPTLTLALADPGYDYEWGLNVSGNRMALNFSLPSGGFWLTHLIVSARRDLVFPVRGVL